jgi:hypothetical protein
MKDRLRWSKGANLSRWKFSRFTAKPTAQSLWLLFRRSEAEHPAQQHARLREAKLIRQESALSRSNAACCKTSETGLTSCLVRYYLPTADMVVLFRHLENRGVRPVVQSKFGYRWPAVHPFTCAGVKIGFDQRFASWLYSAIARCRSSYSSQGMRQICSRAARCSLAFTRSPWAKWASPRCSCALRCRGLRVRAC